MDGARHARMIKLLLGGGAALLALGAVVMLASSGYRAEAARTPSEGSAVVGEPIAKEPCDGTPGEGPSAMLVNEDGTKHFASLDQAVAMADLVAVATVTEAQPGEIGPSNSPEEQIQTLEATMRMDEVLKGRAPDGPVMLKTMEQAYTSGNTEWRCPGERVLLFLSRSTERPGGFYITNHSQSVYLLAGGGFAPVVRDNLENPVVQRIGSLSLPEFRREVGEAKQKIENGEVKPPKHEF